MHFFFIIYYFLLGNILIYDITLDMDIVVILTTTLDQPRLFPNFLGNAEMEVFRIIKNGVTRATLDNNYIFNYLVRE